MRSSWDIKMYPSDSSLKVLEKWDIIKDPLGCVDYVQDLWRYDDFIRKHKGPDFTFIEMHTGGWSGNEDIIEALHKNHFFGFYFWMESAGGHYWFKINDK